MYRRQSERHSRLLDSLDKHYQIARGVILESQNPVTGLLPASISVSTHGDYRQASILFLLFLFNFFESRPPFHLQSRDAWVRDNVYSIISVWALSIAYE